MKTVALRMLVFIPYALAVWATAYQGLEGDDALGLISILLLLGGTVVIVYLKFFQRTITLGLFSPAVVIVLGLIGVALGTISSGESEIGVIAGLIVAVGAAATIAIIAQRRERRCLNADRMKRTITKAASLTRRVAPYFAALLLTSPAIASSEVLPALSADIRSVTVSGVSSGGYMAVQFHIAHSSMVDGAGVLAGGPYECAAGSTWNALTRCMAPSLWNPLPPVEVFLERALRRAQAGEIDPLDSLADDRAWIFSGGRDETVRWPVVDSLNRFYRPLLPFGQTLLVTRPDAGHAMISTEEPKPNACASTKPPFINRCGDFDAAGELLTHLLGSLAPKREPPAERIRPFDQRPFLGKNVVASGMADEGYIFFPESCESGGCRVHVAFHGCRQTTRQIDRRFVENAGYIEWAQSNRLIVLFPQIVPRYGWTGGLAWIFNPRGCWDWWGYTNADYATRKGHQIKAVHEMVERLGESDTLIE